MAPSRTLHHYLGLLLILTPPSALIPECTAFQTTTSDTFLHPTSRSRIYASTPTQHPDAPQTSPPAPHSPVTASMPSTRRAILSFLVTSTAATIAIPALPAFAAEEEESFANIAARASRLANQASTSEDRGESSKEQDKIAKRLEGADGRNAYDFKLPVAGKDVSFGDLIGQTFGEPGEDGKRGKGELVKAVLIVNMKQDDPIARKNIPELMSLAGKFGTNKEFVVICTPSDQGYFEPDTSELIRLKLASEYGYGLNPATLLTDKVNLLGTGAHPFWRWIEGTCRTPSGLGRIQGNFEKFLVDGRTGRPLRRYPRQYEPLDIAADIDAVVAGRKLPPAGSNWKEEWRSADAEAVADQFRFQKGLNYYDQ